MTSGLVLLPNVTWLSFHSGYDFGYLVKLLTCSNLPTQVRRPKISGRGGTMCWAPLRLSSMMCIYSA